MSCSDWASGYDALTQFAFFDAIWCTFANSLGPLLTAVLVFGGIGIALYVVSGSLVLPLVLTIILGGVVVVQLPGGVVQLVGLVVLLGVAAGGYFLVRKLEGP